MGGDAPARAHDRSRFGDRSFERTSAVARRRCCSKRGRMSRRARRPCHCTRVSSRRNAFDSSECVQLVGMRSTRRNAFFSSECVQLVASLRMKGTDRVRTAAFRGSFHFLSLPSSKRVIGGVPPMERVSDPPPMERISRARNRVTVRHGRRGRALRREQDGRERALPHRALEARRTDAPLRVVAAHDRYALPS